MVKHQNCISTAKVSRPTCRLWLSLASAAGGVLVAQVEVWLYVCFYVCVLGPTCKLWLSLAQVEYW